MIIKIEHTRAIGCCRKGVKKFLENHKLDWKEFLTEGLSEETLLKTNDAMAFKAVKFARKQNGK